MSGVKPKSEKSLEELTEEELNKELIESKGAIKGSIYSFIYGGIVTGSALLAPAEILQFLSVYFLVMGTLAMLVGVGHLYNGVKTYKKCKTLLEQYEEKEEI